MHFPAFSEIIINHPLLANVFMFHMTKTCLRLYSYLCFQWIMRETECNAVKLGWCSWKNRDFKFDIRTWVRSASTQYF